MARQATQTAALPAETVAMAARSPHLDASLDRAHKYAVGQHHSGVTSEHLLFTLTEDPEAQGVLGASTISVERLRADISTYLAQLQHDTPPGKPVLPTADLLKVLKLAAMAAQQSARRQIDGAIVLAAMIGDGTTPSAGMLRSHGLTFNEVIRVLQKGSASGQPAQQAAPPVPTPPGSPATELAATTASPAAPPRRDDASTDEILASVRARLQGAAPPVVSRRPEPAAGASAATDLATPNTEKTATELAQPAVQRGSQISPPTPPVSQPALQAVVPPTGTEPPTVGLEVNIESIEEIAKQSNPVEVTKSTLPIPPPMPPKSIMADAGPRTPDDLSPPRPLPALGATPSSPPPMPFAVSAGLTRMPPPPLPTAATLSQNLSATLQQKVAATPPLNGPSAGPSIGQLREPARQVAPPPIPSVTVDMRALVNAMPKAMRCGQTNVIEITVPRRALEIPYVPGHRWPPLRVATLRLKAADDRAFVEMASPETLWIGPPRAHQGADDATWRWRVSPSQSGRLKLTLSGATRIVGSEGISAEIPFGEETVEIDVARRRSRRGFVGLLLFGNLLAVGLLAMIMSGRAAEIARGAWAGIRSLWGG